MIVQSLSISNRSFWLNVLLLCRICCDRVVYLLALLFLWCSVIANGQPISPHSLSLKQSVSLQELEKYLGEIREQVEHPCNSSESVIIANKSPLCWYLIPDEEATLTSQVRLDSANKSALQLSITCGTDYTEKHFLALMLCHWALPFPTTLSLPANPWPVANFPARWKEFP